MKKRRRRWSQLPVLLIAVVVVVVSAPIKETKKSLATSGHNCLLLMITDWHTSIEQQHWLLWSSPDETTKPYPLD